MKLHNERTSIPIDETPPQVLHAIATIGHWLAELPAQDLDTDVTITDKSSGRIQRIRYKIVVKEVGRMPWPIEGETVDEKNTNPV